MLRCFFFHHHHPKEKEKKRAALLLGRRESVGGVGGAAAAPVGSQYIKERSPLPWPSLGRERSSQKFAFFPGRRNIIAAPLSEMGFAAVPANWLWQRRASRRTRERARESNQTGVLAEKLSASVGAQSWSSFFYLRVVVATPQTRTTLAFNANGGRMSSANAT